MPARIPNTQPGTPRARLVFRPPRLAREKVLGEVAAAAETSLRSRPPKVENIFRAREFD